MKKQMYKRQNTDVYNGKNENKKSKTEIKNKFKTNA